MCCYNAITREILNCNKKNELVLKDDAKIMLNFVWTGFTVEWNRLLLDVNIYKLGTLKITNSLKIEKQDLLRQLQWYSINCTIEKIRSYKIN